MFIGVIVVMVVLIVAVLAMSIDANGVGTCVSRSVCARLYFVVVASVVVYFFYCSWR